MRLIRCKKCGAAICTEDNLIERMSDFSHELNEKARHCEDWKVAKTYLAEAASVTKIMKGIIHATANIETRKVTLQCEYAELVHYVREHDLITDEKLNELRVIAREKAKALNQEEQKEIDRLYGDYKSLYNPVNVTNADPTARKALSNMRGEKG